MVCMLLLQPTTVYYSRHCHSYGQLYYDRHYQSHCYYKYEYDKRNTGIPTARYGEAVELFFAHGLRQVFTPFLHSLSSRPTLLPTRPRRSASVLL